MKTSLVNVMNCEMCGKSLDKSFKVEVEGVEMQLCDGCSSFGRIIERPKTIVKIKKKIVKKEEFYEAIVEDYTNKIKNARELRNLKQKDLANKLAIKESLLHKIESGNMNLNLDIAKKLERFLNIKLIEKQKEEHQKVKTEDTILTIGDMLKIKK